MPIHKLIKTDGAAATQVYQLKITLRGSKPPIWRRVQVPPDITLAKLHQIIQILMGWDGGHLHEFSDGELTYGPPYGGGFGEGPSKDEKKVKLNQLLAAPKQKLEYLYDFGDSWEHQVVLEKILPAEAGVRYPVCTEGKLAAPPDDIGGIPGFYNMLEVIADPTSPEYENMVDWLVGGDWDDDEDMAEVDIKEVDPKKIFDPEAFELATINERLMRLK